MISILSSKPFTEVGPLRTLLASVVDYAGLFPPAGHTTEAAAAAFDRYRQGAHAWMLGCFVVPAERVEELAREVAARAPTSPWPISVIVGSTEEGAQVGQDIATRFEGTLRLAALEVRPLGAESIHGGHAHTQTGVLEAVDVFYEVPLDDRMADRLDAIAAVGARAKLRTGGVTAALIPSPGPIVRFLEASAARGIAFKATAGLHHAFPNSYPLTYEPESACARMHGFISLLLVAALLHARHVDGREAADLLDGGTEALQIEDAAVRWHGRRLTVPELAEARADFFRSFGSCSFEEPVEELRAAGLL